MSGATNGDTRATAHVATTINLQHGGLTSETEAARERRALIFAYFGAWIFGVITTTIYVAGFGEFDGVYAVNMVLMLVGLAYGAVVFNPKVPRGWSLVPTMLVTVVLLVMGIHLDQPGVNSFLLVPLVFTTFFLWRDKGLYLVAMAIMVVAYCALPLAIGGMSELRRVVIGGAIFTMIGGLSFLLVRRAGTLQLERSTFQSTVSSLLTALNARDGASRERTLKTVQLAEEVALEMGLGESDREQVRYAAYLHDIGKLGVPNELFDKRGPLTAEEWEVLREHPVVGERIVRSVPGFDDVATIVRHEHENWNGSGYPDGLSGDRIPIESRIIQVCAAYGELFEAAAEGDEAASAVVEGEMRARAGTHFDPDVVTALLAIAEERDTSRSSRVLDLSLRLAG